MRLLYTLRYGSVAGNCGGDLRLFFTTQNPSDWKPAPPPPGYVDSAREYTRHADAGIGGCDYVCTVSGEQRIAGGAVSLWRDQREDQSGQVLGNMPIGQATVLMAPGKPEVTIWKGRTQGTAGGVTWDIGFEMAVPWDGTSADCNGQWWAVWH